MKNLSVTSQDTYYTYFVIKQKKNNFESATFVDIVWTQKDIQGKQNIMG